MPKRKDANDTGFSERLQRAMDKKGWSRSQLAREMFGTILEKRGENVYPVPKNRQTISRYLRGETVPSPETRRQLAETLDVAYQELFPFDDPLERSGSGIAMSEVKGGKVMLDVHLLLPIDLAMEIVKKLEPHAT